jgi:TfoX/Sxy family transcriptional regulator of competence genes
MVASDSFAEFLREQLGPLGRITLRRMFGKTGVFCDGVMLGMVTDNMLYLRVDELSREAFKEAASSPPLNYAKGGSTIDLSFWRPRAVWQRSEDGPRRNERGDGHTSPLLVRHRIDREVDRPLQAVEVEGKRLLEAVERRGPARQAHGEGKLAALQLQVRWQAQAEGDRLLPA